MFRCYGLFRHVVRTMTLEDPNRFKTSRSFVLGAHVVKLQCKQSASVLSQSQTLMTNVFFLSMTTPPPAKMKKKLTSDKLVHSHFHFLQVYTLKKGHTCTRT